MTASDPAIGRARTLPIVERAAGSGATTLLYALWIFELFEPHWFVSSFVGGAAVLHRVPTILLLPLLLVTIQNSKPRAVYWPLILFWMLHAFGLPFAENRGLALAGLKSITRLTLLFVATVSMIDTPEKAIRLLKLFLLSFLWYGSQGLSGLVPWHTELGNPDGFGAFMVVAIGFGYFYGLGAGDKRQRLLGFAVAGLGMLGVVTSFARGAALGAAGVIVLIWIYSPQKLKTLAGGAIAAVVMLVAIQIIYPAGEFWDEMATIIEGTSTGTGLDRKMLWEIAIEVWKEEPIFGVGAYCTGAVAARVIPWGMFEGSMYHNPETLYNRAFHNTFLQLLAEEGVVGLGLWLSILWGSRKRLVYLRTPAVRKLWRDATDGYLDIRCISIGLELSFAGFMSGAFFYNLVYPHLCWTLITLTYMLWSISGPDSQLARRARALREAPHPDSA